jgi:hypothetical protein
VTRIGGGIKPSGGMNFVLFSCVSVYILAAPRYEPAVSFGFIDLVFVASIWYPHDASIW